MKLQETTLPFYSYPWLPTGQTCLLELAFVHPRRIRARSGAACIAMVGDRQAGQRRPLRVYRAGLSQKEVDPSQGL